MTPAELELAITQVKCAIKLLERTRDLVGAWDAPDRFHTTQINRLLGDLDAELSYLRAYRRPDVAAAIEKRQRITTEVAAYGYYATTDDYDGSPEDPIGHGTTREAAVADLVEQLGESEPCMFLRPQAG